MPEKRQPTMEPLDEEVDHVRGPAAARLIVEYGDYECPYSRQAFRAIERVERRTRRTASASPSGTSRSPRSTRTPSRRRPPPRQPRSRTGSGTCTSCSSIARRRSKTTTCSGYAAELGLDVHASTSDRAGADVLARIRRDVESGMASGEVRGTPTLFIDGVVHRGGYDAATLMEAWPDERDLLAHRQHQADGAAGRDRRLRGLPRDRGHLGAPAHVPVLRPHRLLRQLAEPARLRPRRELRSTRSSAPPSPARTGAGATSTTSRSCVTRRHDAARAAPGRLAPDEGHAAPVRADRRQDPARHHGAAQPLVERSRSTSTSAGSRPGACIIATRPSRSRSTSSITPWSCGPPTVAPSRSSSATDCPSPTSTPASTRCSPSSASTSRSRSSRSASR